MPGMVLPRRQRQPDLADDLRPQMQRIARVLPCGIGQFGPTFFDAEPWPIRGSATVASSGRASLPNVRIRTTVASVIQLAFSPIDIAAVDQIAS